MATKELYKVDQNTGKQTYAGYAKFGSDGSYQGSAGGYGRGRNSNNPNNGASRLQNTIANAGARQAARARRAGL